MNRLDFIDVTVAALSRKSSHADEVTDNSTQPTSSPAADLLDSMNERLVYHDKVINEWNSSLFDLNCKVLTMTDFKASLDELKSEVSNGYYHQASLNTNLDELKEEV